MGEYSTTASISVSIPTGGFERAELVFEGVDQGGPSFEGRVYLDNPSAGTSTPRTAEEGYVGAFHVYGYGPTRPAWPGGSVPIVKRVTATEPIRVALARRRGELTVTVVPRPEVPAPHFERVSVVFG
jgi:hypothetical protein